MANPRSRRSVLVTEEFTEVQLRDLRRQGFQVAYDPLVKTATGEERRSNIARALNGFPEANVLYARDVPHEWEPTWRLDWIQLHWAGVDHLDGLRVHSQVRITTASGIHASAIAEHVLMVTLALRRRLHGLLMLQEAHTWAPDRLTTYRSELLSGSTIGILGYGSIGREVARLAMAFGMRVLAVKRDLSDLTDRGYTVPGHGDPNGEFPERYFGLEAVQEMLPHCDVVVNALPLTPQTRNSIGEAAFEVMKSMALYVSVGRGETTDEEALRGALTDQVIAGAALDVFRDEPLAEDSVLWSVPNLIATPHTSAIFTSYNKEASDLFMVNLLRYASGDELLNRYSTDLGY